MGPPSQNDPNYSNDPSSGGEEAPIEVEKPEEPDPDDGPSLEKLALPKSHPSDDRQFAEEIHMPMVLFDAMFAKPKALPEPNLIPKLIDPEPSSDATTVIYGDYELPDIDISMPFLYGTNIEEPDCPLDENSWPKADKDCIPNLPGASNELGIGLPPLPDPLPCEP